MFNVLKPIYTPTEVKKPEPIYVVTWEKLGTAQDMAEARAITPYPVLEKLS